ncbi:hypothetical protein HK102_001150 [Quaeritorhiza haematococci]|nr:hypothetical protein HK102_001150 [Quaeritorhiza haematococci]
MKLFRSWALLLIIASLSFAAVATADSEAASETWSWTPLLDCDQDQNHHHNNDCPVTIFFHNNDYNLIAKSVSNSITVTIAVSFPVAISLAISLSSRALSAGEWGGIAGAAVVVLSVIIFFVFAKMKQTHLRAKPTPVERGGVEIEFKNVGYEIGGKVVLKPCVSGIAKPGRVLAIMGPSGAGKSTFLDILAGKSKSGRISGEILINGKRVHLSNKGKRERVLKGLVGFVDQEDLLMDSLSVEETLMFSAGLRCAESLGVEERRERVERVLEQLGLTHIRHSRIGGGVSSPIASSGGGGWFSNLFRRRTTAGTNDADGAGSAGGGARSGRTGRGGSMRGISGGEKRRVSIGVELVPSPPLLFLDEPTSGLDSHSSFILMQHLTTLAHVHNKTIIFTIHQPRSDVFMMFDDLLVLGRGKNFSTAVSTPEARQAFVRGIIQLFDKYPTLFDRVDIDWEYISPPGQNWGDPGNKVGPKDPENFIEFLALLRQTLDSSNRSHVEISACVTGDPNKMQVLPLRGMVQYLDTINIMTYDFASSSWGPCPAGHHANLKTTPYSPLSVERAVETYIHHGVPPHKIVIGVAFYSRGFANTDGLGRPSSGVVADKSWEDGVCDYKSLPREGAVEYWDDVAKAHYSYDPRRRILNSYDTVRSVQEKCKYVWDRGLKGIIGK